ncbi:MAG: CapA family protein [Acidobacteriia bacterium]|nr:CapA family protein [Terriglobia bacterium]
MTSSAVLRSAAQATLACLLLAVAPAAADPPAAGHDVRLMFTGDILLSRQVEIEMARRHGSPWMHLQKLLQSADWAGGNLEGALGSASDCVPSRSPCFAVSDTRVAFLKSAGFRGVTIENNHAGDLGTAGRRQTRESLQRAGLMAIDFENSPQFVRVNNVELAFLALTTIPAADGRVQELPSPEVSEKLRAARQRADFVIVSIHWGNELIPWPGEDQRKGAAWLVEHGADLVLGHHPHVIQPPECVEGRPVFFSLGNHVFDQANPTTKEGLIADCRADSKRLRCQSIRTHTRPGSSFPSVADPDRAANAALAQCVDVRGIASSTAH